MPEPCPDDPTTEVPDPDKRRFLRTRAGLSQQALAELLGTSFQNVSRWERGTNVPRGAMRQKYLEFLEIIERSLG